MDLRLREIIDSLPMKPHRSRLGPYAELIIELRTLGWTYRAIAKLLGDKFGHNVSPSNLHHFVKTAIQRKEANQKQQPGCCEVFTRHQAVLTKAEVNDRLTALKQRSSEQSIPEKRFEFDPDEPLRLSLGGDVNTSGNKEKV